MKITITVIILRQLACLYIYKKKKKFRNVFIYKKPNTLQKDRKFCSDILYKNQDTLCYAVFHEIFEVGIYIQKYDTLRYVTFLYTKIQTLGKKQDNFSYVFI